MNNRCGIFLLIVILCGCGGVSAAEGTWTTISMPATITSPGMYLVSHDYTAVNDSKVGVEILSSDVTLDGGGHTFSGDNLTSSKAVSLQTSSNSTIQGIVIQNLNIQYSDFGIKHNGESGSVHNIRIENISDTGSITGMEFFDIQNGYISNASLSGNWVGVDTERCKNMSFITVSIARPEIAGYIFHTVSQVTINNASVKDGRYDVYPSYAIPGIQIFSGERFDIRKTAISNTSQYGIRVMNSTQVHLDDVSVSRIWFNPSAASTADKAGIVIGNTSGFSVNHATIQENNDGIFLRNATGGIISGSRIDENTQSGLTAHNTTNTVLYNNIFNNSANLLLDSDDRNITWNVSLESGTNIVGGPNLGGNFWAAPNNTGFSQTHPDRGDGICNAPYELTSSQVDYLPLAGWNSTLIADFTADVTRGVPLLRVAFTDASSGVPTRWNWSFGDQSFSHEQNPVHAYHGIGRYTVTLEVSDPNGRTGVIQKPSFIVTDTERVTGPDGNGLALLLSFRGTGIC